MPPNFRRYDFENPPSDPDDDEQEYYDQSSAYEYFPEQFDGDHGDEFDRYEDYVETTGHDPYGVFSDDTKQMPLLRLKWRWQAIQRAVRHFWKWHTSAKYRRAWDDIPF